MVFCFRTRNLSFLEVPDRFSDHGSELQIRGGIEDNSNIFFLIFYENIRCDPSLELSQRSS